MDACSALCDKVPRRLYPAMFQMQAVIAPNSCQQRRSPDDTLKLPEGHNVHEPADAPPQPLRYRPAEHDEVEQLEQTEAPGPSMHNHLQATVQSNIVSNPQARL